MRRLRAVLLTLLLLTGLVTVPVVLTWRQVQQERLNHALIVAVEQRDARLVRRLLRQGANPNAPVLPDDKRSVWQRLRDVLWRGSVSPTVPRTTILAKAVEWTSADIRSYSRHHRDATLQARDATLQALVDAGADVNGQYQKVSSYGRNTGPGFRTMPLIEAARQSDWKAVQVLLDHRANINAADEYGDTALMFASWHGNAEQVEALIKRGARVNAKDDHGETALFWICNLFEPDRHNPASFVSYGSEETSVRKVVTCLLRHGASVNNRDSEGKTILKRGHEWHDDKQLFRMLKQAGARE